MAPAGRCPAAIRRASLARTRRRRNGPEPSSLGRRAGGHGAVSGPVYPSLPVPGGGAAAAGSVGDSAAADPAAPDFEVTPCGAAPFVTAASAAVDTVAGTRSVARAGSAGAGTVP